MTKKNFYKDKKMVWIRQETHTRLKLESFKMNATVWQLADIAIASYLDTLTRKSTTNNKEEAKING